MSQFEDLLNQLRTNEDGITTIRTVSHPDDLLAFYRRFMIDDADFPTGIGFEEVEEFLVLLCKLFPNYTFPISELAYLQTNVMDNDEAAIQSFNRAILLATDQLINALSGLAECYLYMGYPETAKELLLRITNIDPGNERIEDLMDQIRKGPTQPFGPKE